jgi:hypothetical protein
MGAATQLAQGREPEDSEKDGNHADVQTNQGEAPERARGRLRRLKRNRDVHGEGDRVAGEDCDPVCFTIRPGIVYVDVGTSEAWNGVIRCDRERHHGFVDNDRADGQLFRAGIAHLEFDIVSCERISLDIKILDGHRSFEVEPAAGGQEEGDDASQKNNWDQ